jgi:hypothetical protein
MCQVIFAALRHDCAQSGHTFGGGGVGVDDSAQQVLAGTGATGAYDAHALVVAVAELRSHGASFNI